MTGIERARELLAEIDEVLVLAALESKVETTIEFSAIPSILDSGTAAVTVLPSRQKFPNYTHTEHEWTVLVVAGPIQDQVAAWELIDQIIAALKDPLDIEAAEPADYQTPNGPGYPAYTLTMSETI